MNFTPPYLTDLTNAEQQKLDLALQLTLFRLQNAGTLEETVHGLMTVNGDANAMTPALLKQYGPDFAVAYKTGDIISFDVPARLLYDLAKDRRVADISMPKQSRYNE